MKNCLCTLAAVTLFALAAAPSAQAACVSPDQRTGSNLAARVLSPKFLASAVAAAGAATSDDSSIVGLWNTTFYVGDSSDIWDQAYEQWHSDGTELAVDNGVPPVLGNVCVGVWKQAGKTIKLRHLTWNWNLDGSKAGTFVLLMTASVDRGGKTFSGTYITDSYDLDGNVIPELHAEGVVRGTRITVD